MEIRIVADIKSCKQCPLRSSIHEHGACGDICGVSREYYAWITEYGVRKDCPFREVSEIYYNDYLPEWMKD